MQLFSKKDQDIPIKGNVPAPQPNLNDYAVCFST